jgi:ribonuclease VapC
MPGVVVDTSAVISVLFGEPDAEMFRAMLLRRGSSSISVVNALECVMVARRVLGGEVEAVLDLTLRELSISLAPVSEEQYRIARAAFLRFGKGTGHAARLNFGDCFAYALAVDLGAPLLFKGDDFTRTDVAVAA